ncbi:MAG: nuclear transport factor 2 family protein [Xanthobacteraceae bacterium]|uniref:nuclear transport factor 2 family protein n=1 Tax=Pseudolabrys sp. TaxID=1960880 RepID=UPI003D108403
MSLDPLAAIDIAKAYLAAMESRDLARAKSFLAPGIEFIFPGGARLNDLDAIVAGSAKRYQFVGKHIESIDAAPVTGGGVAVYVRGTLHGRWLDGGAFEGIRFIDRIEVRDGLIVRQDVWNDSGEIRNAVR